MPHKAIWPLAVVRLRFLFLVRAFLLSPLSPFPRFPSTGSPLSLSPLGTVTLQPHEQEKKAKEKKKKQWVKQSTPWSVVRDRSFPLSLSLSGQITTYLGHTASNGGRERESLTYVYCCHSHGYKPQEKQPLRHPFHVVKKEEEEEERRKCPIESEAN